MKAADTHGVISELVDQAINGQDALKKVKEAEGFQYGLIFMDCSMPIMDGYEATEKIRKYLKTNGWH